MWKPESLDPENWDDMRKLVHQAVDDSLDYLESIRDRAVWQPAGEDVLQQLKTRAPLEPQGARRAYDDFVSLIRPYQLGNSHPRFWGWYLGGGTVIGALGEFLAAMENSSVAGGNHIGVHVEKQVLDWCRQMVGFPDEASGVLVSGASIGNIIALAVARHVMSEVDVRAHGVAGLARPVAFYTSVEAHSSVQRALELLGLGSCCLRKVRVTERYAIDTDELQQMIDRDRAADVHPWGVIGTAGTTNTGAVDDLATLAAICRKEKMWFHVDGAIGAIVALSSAHRHVVRGMEEADSLTMDLHKWMQVPFEAGCVFVKRRADHRDTFTTTPEYLERHERGISAGDFWLSDYGPQLSRGFRALKIWLSIKEQGTARYARLVDRCMSLAQQFSIRLGETAELKLLAPVVLNIVCFRYDPGGMSPDALNELNRELVMRLQESGVAVPSYTTLDGRFCMRVAFANHRTRAEDLDIFVDAALKLGEKLSRFGRTAE